MDEEQPRPSRGLAELIRKRWRGWLRALHRDIGYFIVGLTFIYALSGLAINHVGQFDPNFKAVTAEYALEVEVPRDDVDAAAKAVLGQLGIDAEPRDYFFEDEDRLEIYFDKRTVIADLAAGTIA